MAVVVRRAGPFEVESSLINRGQSVRETTWTVSGREEIQEITVGESSARFDGGLASLSCEMPLDTRLPIRIRGQALASASLQIAVSAGGQRAGSLSLALRVERPASEERAEIDDLQRLRCERDGEVLPFEEIWHQELQQTNIFSWEAPPDLSRWQARAETRAAREGGDPSLVREIFLELSRAERAQEPPTGTLYRYKLGPGGPWILGEREARTIAGLLGKRHPLGGFAARGPFQITGEASKEPEEEPRRGSRRRSNRGV